MTQANPLLEYAQTRNAEAFAAVIQQYQRLVFATCRRKLHDQTDLDDAVQETFLRLAQKAGGLHSNVGGWLHRCAVNVALDLNRRHDTRRRHESTAASYRHEPIDDAQQALAELREQIDAALEKLSDDQRELIVQRYFVGRPQVELAAEAGVTPSAITHRLDRAIEALRSHLSQSGFSPAVAVGGAAAVEHWLSVESASAAVPAHLTANLMKIGLSGLTSGGGATIGAGILIKVFLALAAALVVGAGIWLALSGQVSPIANSPTTAPSPQALAAPTTGPAAFTVRAAADDRNQPPQWQATSQPAQQAALSGRVMDRDGKPIAGAVVELYPVSRGGGVALPPRPPQATADADGVYAFPTVEREGDYKVAVEADGHVGIPVSMSTTTLHIAANAHSRRDFVLDRGVTVNVTISSLLGEPLRGATVDATPLPFEMTRESNLSRKETDSLGQVKYVLPVSKQTYLITASMKGCALQHVTLVPDSPDHPKDVSLALGPGLKVSGVAMCNDGKPAAGWGLYALPDWWAVSWYTNGIKIDDDGKFAMTDISPGRYKLLVMVPEGGGMSSTVDIGMFDLPPADQPLQVKIPAPSPSSRIKVVGRVRIIGKWPSGDLDDRVWAQLNGLSEKDRFQMVEIPIRQRRPGGGEYEYTFENVLPGTYSIMFTGESIQRASIDKIQLPGDVPVVELHTVGTARIAGSVVDAATSQPVSHFAFRVRQMRTSGSVQDPKWIQVSDPQGKFAADLIEAGDYRVQVSADGYAWSWSADVHGTAGQTGEVQVRLSSGGALAGRVIDPDGKPLAGAKVIALSMAGNITDGFEQRFENDAGAVITDEQGHFTLPHLSPGEETIRILHDGFAPAKFQTLKIIESQTTDAGELRLPIGGSVEGTTYDASGKPLAGLVLYFQDASGYSAPDEDQIGRLATATSDQTGHFKVEHLPAEAIFIHLVDGGRREGVQQRVVFPVDGQIAHVDFGGTIAISGRLLSADGNPIANHRLELANGFVNTAAIPVLASTDAQGNFSFFGPPPGRYALYVETSQPGLSWAALRNEIDISDQPIDLGDVANDAPPVAIALISDDPGTFAGAKTMDIETDLPGRVFQQMVAIPNKDDSAGKVWVAPNLPPGRYRARVISADEAPVIYYLSFERAAQGSAQRIELRVPRATASLTLVASKPFAAGSNFNNYAVIRSDDGRIEAYVNLQAAKQQPLKLPPDTYTICDRSTMQPRAGTAPIVLAPGESREAAVDPVPPNSEKSEREVLVRIWDSTGVLMKESAEIRDDANRLMPMAGEANLGGVYILASGHYRASIQRRGSVPSLRDFDVPMSVPTPRDLSGTKQATVDLFIPRASGP